LGVGDFFGCLATSLQLTICLPGLMSPLFVARWIPLFLPFVPAALASPPYVIHIRMSPAIHVTSGRSITLRVFAVIQQQQQYLSQLREYVYSQIRWCYARCGWKPVYEPRHQAVI